jgi:phosphoribosylformylglycinamidine synthase subunit PurQ / glutaminase
MASRIGIVTFPGTCDDRDAARAVEIVGGVAVHLWHGDDHLQGVDGVFLPGGFSFGDHLRCGAIASHSPVMAAVRRFAGDGGPVLGVCNGFQMLCEAGLLPGILQRNHHGRFNCLEADLVVERTAPWTGETAPGTILRVPVKHGDGAWYAPGDSLPRLEAAGQVLLRYASNVNGAAGRVAGVCNAAGNVFGLMPHPEHAVDPLLGPTDGRVIVGGLLALTAVAA